MKKIFVTLLCLLYVISCTTGNGIGKEDSGMQGASVSEEDNISQTDEENLRDPENKFIDCYVNGSNDHVEYLELDIDKGGEFEVRTEQDTYLGYVGTEPGLFKGYDYRHNPASGVNPPAEFSNGFITVRQTAGDTYKITVSPVADLDFISSQVNFYPLEDLSYCFGSIKVYCRK